MKRSVRSSGGLGEWCFGLALCASLAACRSDRGAALAPTAVDLARAANAEGEVRLELGNEGALSAGSAEVDVAGLPQLVRDAALADAPEALLVGAAREWRGWRWLWRVRTWYDARAFERLVDEEGETLETARALNPEEWPEHVLAAADEAVGGGVVKQIEVVQPVPGASYFRVEKERGGARYEILVGGDGAVLRSLREQRAVIAVPVEK